MNSLNANQLLDYQGAEPDPIWGPTICTHNLVMVVAPTGVGKTRFTMKLVHTMSATGKFLAWHVSRPRRVLYVDGELGLVGMKRIFRGIQAEAPFSPQGDFFRVLTKDQCGGPRLWNISDPRDQLKYNKEIGEAEVIVFDNLLSCNFPLHNRDDEVRQWDRILPWFHALRDSGRTVIMIHHTGKSGDQLGTSVKENWLDTSIELKPPEVYRPIAGTEFTLKFRKTRDVKRCDAQPMHVEYLTGEDGIARWSWSPVEDTKKRQIDNLRLDGLSKREVARTLGISYVEVSRNWETT